MLANITLMSKLTILPPFLAALYLILVDHYWWISSTKWYIAIPQQCHPGQQILSFRKKEFETEIVSQEEEEESCIHIEQQ
jgi:hypothetical protein